MIRGIVSVELISIMIMPNVKIIELFGLPGCGKSTLVKSILSVLRKSYPNDVKSRSDILGVVNKLRDRPFLLFFVFVYHIIKPGYYMTKITLLRFSVFFPFNRYVIFYLLYIIIVLELSRKKRSEIIVLDEGLIQSISSIPHDNIIKRADLINGIARQVEKINIDILYVECSLNRKSNLQRIKQRNRNDRFAFKNGLDDLLTVKEANIAMISNVLAKNKIIVDMQRPYDLSAIELIDKLFNTN